MGLSHELLRPSLVAKFLLNCRDKTKRRMNIRVLQISPCETFIFEKIYEYLPLNISDSVD